MSYYIARTVSMPFERVLEQLLDRLRERGFGVLSDIDVQSTLKSKIGVDIGKYRILGACNPRFAHDALQLEDKLGVMLPCNVVVRETADHQVEVASIDPVAAMDKTGNPALRPTAEHVRGLLAQVVYGIGSADR
jgi:uncharacterized protein (DUF302 family)